MPALKPSLNATHKVLPCVHIPDLLIVILVRISPTSSSATDSTRLSCRRILLHSITSIHPVAIHIDGRAQRIDLRIKVSRADLALQTSLASLPVEFDDDARVVVAEKTLECCAEGLASLGTGGFTGGGFALALGDGQCQDPRRCGRGSASIPFCDMLGSWAIEGEVEVLTVLIASECTIRSLRSVIELFRRPLQ